MSQKCFFKIMDVDPSSLQPGSESRDAPSDCVCKLESVKPFFPPPCLMKTNCNFKIDQKEVRVPKPPKLAPAVPMGSCAAAAGPAKPPPWHPGGGTDPQELAEGAWFLWGLDTSRREEKPQLGMPVHTEISAM